MGKRVKAWSLHYEKTAPNQLQFITQPFELLSNDVAELAIIILANIDAIGKIIGNVFALLVGIGLLYLILTNFKHSLAIVGILILIASITVASKLLFDKFSVTNNRFGRFLKLATRDNFLVIPFVLTMLVLIMLSVIILPI